MSDLEADNRRLREEIARTRDDLEHPHGRLAYALGQWPSFDAGSRQAALRRQRRRAHGLARRTIASYALKRAPPIT